MARRPAAGLAVDGGHRRRHRRCRAAVAGSDRGPGTPGGAVLGVVGHGALECLSLVPRLAATRVLGPSVAGCRRHARARRPIRAIGAGLRTQAHQMLHWWHRGRDGTLAPARFGTSRRPLRQEVERRLEAGHTGGVPNTAGVCRELLTRGGPCGRSCVLPRSSRRTRPRNGPSGPASSGARAALGPTVRRAPAVSKP